MAWQVVSALVQLFGGKDAKAPERGKYIESLGADRKVADKAAKAKAEREHAIRTARKFDDFIERAKGKGIGEGMGKKITKLE